MKKSTAKSFIFLLIEKRKRKKKLISQLGFNFTCRWALHWEGHWKKDRVVIETNLCWDCTSCCLPVISVFGSINWFNTQSCNMRLDILENSNMDLGSHPNPMGERIHKHAEDSLIMASPLEHAYKKKTWGRGKGLKLNSRERDTREKLEHYTRVRWSSLNTYRGTLTIQESLWPTIPLTSNYCIVVINHQSPSPRSYTICYQQSIF